MTGAPSAAIANGTCASRGNAKSASLASPAKLAWKRSATKQATVRLFLGHEAGWWRNLDVQIERGLADLGRGGHYVDEASGLRIGAGLGGDAAAAGTADEDRRAILPFQRPTRRCDIVAERGRRVLPDADGIVVGCGIKRSYQCRSSPRAIFERVSRRPKRQASACRRCFPTTRPPHTGR